MLSPNVFTLYAEYLNKNLFNFQDLVDGKIKKELDSSAEKKLLFDLKDALKSDFEFTEKQAKQVNKFLNEVRAENKQLFFRDLQELALKDDNFDSKKLKWKKLELFKGLKEFLDLYLK
jgi:6-pyruvoyl-tetrahydropterin synthase